MAGRTYAVDGLRFGLRTNSTSFAAWLDSVPGVHRLEERRDPVYSVVVGEQHGRRREFHILYRGITPIVRTLDLSTLARSLLLQIEGHSLGSRDDSVYADLALLRHAGGATALVPASLIPFLGKRGRQTRSAGIELQGDGSLSIDAEGKAGPIAPRLGPIEGLTAGLEPARHNDHFFVDSPTAPDTVIVFAPGQTDLVRPAARAAALGRLMDSVVNLPLVGGEALLRLARLVEGAACYSLAGAGPGETAEALARLLGETRTEARPRG